MLSATQFACRKGLGTWNAIPCVVNTLHIALEMGQEARMVQIDVSAAFDRVNHQGILIKLCSVGVGGLVLSVPTKMYILGGETDSAIRRRKITRVMSARGTEEAGC